MGTFFDSMPKLCLGGKNKYIMNDKQTIGRGEGTTRKEKNSSALIEMHIVQKPLRV